MSWIAGDTAERYRDFIGEVAEVSPSYASVCAWVAESGDVLAFLEALPEPKRQPNLFLASLRVVAGVPGNKDALERAVAERGAEIAALMRTRATQTNEPGRCAALLPALARIADGRPLALLEVGASAGLCLLPDRYGYDFGRGAIAGRPGAPTMVCAASPSTPLPDRVPEIVWRRGLDLNPLDPASAENRAWLEALVWPEETARVARLARALEVAAANPPTVVRGDLLRDLSALAAGAPDDARLVVFHTAVLAYVEPAARGTFAEAVLGLGAVWLANEDPRVLPDVARRAGPSPAGSAFLLSVDGAPVAWTHPHGAWLDWIG